MYSGDRWNVLIQFDARDECSASIMCDYPVKKGLEAAEAIGMRAGDEVAFAIRIVGSLEHVLSIQWRWQ